MYTKNAEQAKKERARRKKLIELGQTEDLP